MFGIVHPNKNWRFLTSKILGKGGKRYVELCTLWFGIGEKVKIFPWGICVWRFAPLVKNPFQFQLIKKGDEKMSAQTNALENEARGELLSRINEHISFFSGSHNELLEGKFGITDGGDLPNLPISKLTEIADFLDDLFL